MPLKENWKKPHKSRDGRPETIATPPCRDTVRLTPQTTNADAGVYSGFAKSATKGYGVEAVRILGMIAGRESSPYLTDKDRGFIRDMRDKMQVAGSGFVCSQGQVNWLRDVKNRLIENENGEV